MTNKGKWRKSSFSNGQGGDCVELADLGDNILVRDSKLGNESPVLNFTRSELSAWVKGAKAGEFDDLT